MFFLLKFRSYDKDTKNVQIKYFYLLFGVIFPLRVSLIIATFVRYI